MPSPFPGMDPYLSAHWRDVHSRLVIYSCDALQGALPGSLRARVEESVVVLTPQGFSPARRYPDVRVVEFDSSSGGEPSGGAAVADEPILVRTDDAPTETHIEIIDRESGNRVVTVIEFLSPSNKTPGANRDEYLKKQRELAASDTNLVEIDLSRVGVQTLAFPHGNLLANVLTACMACVRRATDRGGAEVYRMPIDRPLPRIKVPLRPTDADVLLALQPIVEQVYRNGAYEGTIDYKAEPDPPLEGSDKAWADQRLRELGLRPAKKPARRNGKTKKR